jgi:FxsC-like protein
VGTGQPDDELAPYFFLSYAHTPQKAWVEKLYEDICSEILERTTLPIHVDAGFIDRQGIPLGGDWREEVGRALATCRVFVPLYSPRYFTRRECGIEWHAFAQRILDHRAREPSTPTPIVPAIWTPVRHADIPDAARPIQMNHADLGADYAREGFYTLIKNNLYREEYVTAVQRLAQHIIRAAETPLRPCQVRDLGPPRNAFDMPARQGPADRRLTVVVAAPSSDQLPDGRSEEFYGASAVEWNPFHPGSRQPIGEYAAGVARLNSYQPSLLALEDALDFFAAADPSNGLGLLLVDAWAGRDESLSRRLRALDDLRLGWVGTMVPWNSDDLQTRSCAADLHSRLQTLMPHRLGETRPFAPVNSKISTLEQFRARLPDILEGALFRYLDHVEAHPPPGTIPPRPRLSGPDERHTTGREDDQDPGGDT